jgi:hypothetical protein
MVIGILHLTVNEMKGLLPDETHLKHLPKSNQKTFALAMDEQLRCATSWLDHNFTKTPHRNPALTLSKVCVILTEL